MAQFKHVVPQGDNDELGILRTIFDVISNNRNVAEVKSGVNLIHEVQRRGFVDMQSENQSEGTQRLLASRQIGDVFPALLGWHDTEDDTFGERVHAVNELQLGITTQSDHLIHLLQLQRYRVETGHELV